MLLYCRFYFALLSYVQARKLKELQVGGQVVPYAGQLGRAQQHYTVNDKELMQKVWAEDLWPVIREKLRQRGVIVGAVSLPCPAADSDPAQRSIASFFANTDQVE